MTSMWALPEGTGLWEEKLECSAEGCARAAGNAFHTGEDNRRPGNTLGFKSMGLGGGDAGPQERPGVAPLPECG